jgi:hypothetical protein
VAKHIHKQIRTDESLFKKVILWTLISACALGVIYTISLIVRFATSPNQMDFGEGFIMYISKLWASGTFQWNPTVEPYMPMMYGTIFPTLTAPFVLLFGPDLRIGRAFELLATIVITILIYIIAKRYTNNKLIPYIAAFLPFTFFGYQEWIMQSRVEMVGIMFEIIGLYIALRFWNSGKKVLWSIPLFLLAYFTKQPLITIPIAIAICLFVANRKMFLRYFLIMAVSLVAIIGIGSLLTDGQYFKQMFNYNVTTPFFNHKANIFQVFFMTIFPLAFQLVISIAYIVKKLTQNRTLNILAVWALVALFINGFTMLRYASFVNYALESIIAIGLLTALYLDNKINQRLILGSGLALQILFVGIFFSNGLHFIPMPDKDYQTRIDKVASIIQDAKEPIYTEHAGFLLNNGKVPYYESFVYVNLIHKGYFSEQTVLNDLNNQRIEYLVMQSPVVYPPRDNFGHTTLKIIDAMNKNYTIVYNTYDPKGPQNWYSFTVYESNNKLELEKR